MTWTDWRRRGNLPELLKNRFKIIFNYVFLCFVGYVPMSVDAPGDQRHQISPELGLEVVCELLDRGAGNPTSEAVHTPNH